jgi:alanyl-tRNA synthetase
VSNGKKLGKAVYVFSPDKANTKVAHVNYVPPSLKAKGADARTWATEVSDVLGGKVVNAAEFLPQLATDSLFQAGGKDDSAQGVGANAEKVDEAVAVSRKYLSGFI